MGSSTLESNGGDRRGQLIGGSEGCQTSSAANLLQGNE
jgi:hypothetical protein